MLGLKAVSKQPRPAYRHQAGPWTSAFREAPSMTDTIALCTAARGRPRRGHAPGPRRPARGQRQRVAVLLGRPAKDRAAVAGRRLAVRCTRVTRTGNARTRDAAAGSLRRALLRQQETEEKA